MRTQLDVATAPTMPTRGIELMENSTGLMPREIYISAGNQQHEMGGSSLGYISIKAIFVSLLLFHLGSWNVSRHLRWKHFILIETCATDDF